MFCFDVYAAMDIFFFFSIAVFLGVFIPVKIKSHKNKKFVLNHSIALREIKRINNSYTFKKIPNYDMEHDYDNEHFFENVSCKDYLTYQLVYMRKKIADAANDALDNEFLYKKYLDEINEKCECGNYDTDELIKRKNTLIEIEQKLLKKEIQKPQTTFTIKIILNETTINGHWRDEKVAEFSIEQIREIIIRLKNKTYSGFYNDQEIWDAICRVERGKVSNKMRFSIYERDGYRCCKCHRKTNDLEIDHIIPIAKGGKSTYDNLQTLCHRCNLEKGSEIEE